MRSGALIAAAAVGAWVAPAPAPVVPAIAAAFRLPLGLTHSNGIGLTFDDGPRPSGTPAVLDMLAREAVKATFYLVGEQVERWPELAARTAAEGHEIGIHGYHHTLLLRRSPRALGRDLDRAAAIIREATGATPISYRPPYGVFSMAGTDVGQATRLGATTLVTLGARLGPPASGRPTSLAGQRPGCGRAM